MKKICFFLCLTVVLISCTKDENAASGYAPAIFEAKVNGVDTRFEIESASLIHSEDYNKKRMDIAVFSPDRNTKLVLTFTQTPAYGKGMSLKNYPIRFRLEDDPLTSNLDESVATIDGQLMLGQRNGDRYALVPHPQQGSISVHSCDEAVFVISGTFECNLQKQDGEFLNITDGKFSNIRYLYLNE